MIGTMILAATLTSAHPSLAEHRVDAGGREVAVSYGAEVTTRLRQTGMAAGTRPSTERCRWTTRVAVTRHVRAEAGAALSRTLPDVAQLTGSRAGGCAAARRSIEAETAGRHDAVRAHVARVADRDRETLRAELAAARALAAR